MKFIRKNGKVIPIRGEPVSKKIGRIVKGSAKDAIEVGAGTTLLNRLAFKMPLKEAATIGLKYGAIWGGVGLVARSLFTAHRSLKKRRAQNG